MTVQQSVKESKELLDYFKWNYKDKVGSPPIINIYKDKWAAKDLIESFGLPDCKDGILWYFKVSKRYEWKHFVGIADQCITASKSAKKDSENRKKLKSVANEWRDK
jgi:hypothetical protein